MHTISKATAGALALGMGVTGAWFLPPGQGALALFSCAILAHGSRLRQLSLGMLAVSLLAWGWTQHAAWQQHRLWVPESWWNTPLVLSGTLHQVGPKSLGLQLTRACHAEAGCRKVRFNLQVRPKERVPWGKVGDQVRFQARLVPAHQYLNPGGLDQERQAFALHQGYRARGVQWLESHAGPWSLVRARAWLEQRWTQALIGAQHPEALLSLLVGQGHLPELRPILNATGTVHLLAISGLHVVLLGHVVVVLLGAFSVAARTRWWVAVGVVIAYTLLSGCSPPTVRAATMWVVVAGLRQMQSHLGAYTALAWAAALLWFWDPLCVLLRSFWLSFAAMLFVISRTQDHKKEEGFMATWLGHVRMGWGLLPLSVFLFQQASWIAPWANFLAIPCFAWGVVPFVFVGGVLSCVWLGAGGFFFALADAVLHAVVSVLAWMASWPWGHAAWTLTLWGALIGSVALFVAMHPKTPWRGVGLAGCVAGLALFWGQHPPGPQKLRVVLFDVGQGLSMLVQTPEHTLLYDTGTAYAFDREIARSLRYLGVQRLDALVISHNDQDHAGGLPAVRAMADVVYGSASVPEALSCHETRSWVWDRVGFEMLPLPKLPGRISRNNQSCVLRVALGEIAWLLPGDLEHRAERALVASHGEAVRSSILIAPHHGSKTSSDELFLAAVAPTQVWVPVGLSNPYRHPHDVVMARYRQHNVQVRRTDHDGAIIYLDGRLSFMRSGYRLWRARGPKSLRI